MLDAAMERGNINEANREVTDLSRREARIIFVIPGPREGGTMMFAKRQLAGLVDAGVDCTGFYLESRTSIRTLLSEWFRIGAVIKDVKPSLIHANYGNVTGLFCTLVSLIHRIPLVLTLRGSDLNPSPNIPWLVRCFSQLAAWRARRIICVSQPLMQRLWTGSSKVSVIPSPVDTNTFYPIPREEARRTLGWPQDEKVVVFNAGLYPNVKRFDLATEAVEHAKRKMGNIRFEVLRGLTDPNLIPLILNGSDCLLLTSDWEGSPNIIKEALACNLPIVSVEVGDVADWLRNVDGTRIVERDAEALGDALVELLQENKRSNGQFAVLKVALTTLTQRIAEVYRQAIED